MKKYVALFRAINVGGRNLLPMKSLRKYFEELGCMDVQTYIQSGNAVFRHPSKSRSNLEKLIRTAIEANHNFKPEVMILDARCLEDAFLGNPYSTESGKALHFYFFEKTPEDPDREKLNDLEAASESYEIIGKTLYLHAPEGIGRSKLAAKVESCAGVKATARNWNTVLKLRQMLAQSG